MASKRTNGEGTIYRNKQRNRFEGQITVGIKSDGKPIRRKVSGRTRAEVAKRLIEVREIAKVIPEYREPSSILAAVSPLATSCREVYDGFARIRDLRQ